MQRKHIVDSVHARALCRACEAKKSRGHADASAWQYWRLLCSFRRTGFGESESAFLDLRPVERMLAFDLASLGSHLQRYVAAVRKPVCADHLHRGKADRIRYEGRSVPVQLWKGLNGVARPYKHWKIYPTTI